MKFTKYRLTIKHDNETFRFTTAAINKQSAIDMVCGAEGCPSCAIKKIEVLK